MSRNLREEVLTEAVGRLPDGPVVIVETGTLRDGRPVAREADGWSTLCLTGLLDKRGAQGSRLYSIDIHPGHIEISKRTVPAELHPWVTWVCGDSRQALDSLGEPRIDLLYLDSAKDPAVILAEFETVLPKLKPHSVVVVDDTGNDRLGPQGKGTLLIPEAKRRGWVIEHRTHGHHHMSILMLSGRETVAAPAQSS